MTSAFGTLSTEIERSVAELGYPPGGRPDLARLAGQWKCDVWQQALSRARQTYQQNPASSADVVQVEEAVVQGLAQTIAKEIAPCRDEQSATYFYLPKVLQDKTAACLGDTQLVYVLANSLGLRATPVGVLQLAGGDLFAGAGHSACCLGLTDGKVLMVDVSQNAFCASRLCSGRCIVRRAIAGNWARKTIRRDFRGGFRSGTRTGCVRRSTPT